MQSQVMWYCETGGPLSFSAMYGAVGAFLLAQAKGRPWAVLPEADAVPCDLARLRRELHWIGLDPDEIFCGSRPSHDCCCAAAAHLLTGGRAYCGGVLKRRRVLFRLPETPVLRNSIVMTGPRGMMLQPDMKVEISRQGIWWRGADGVCRCCAFAAMPDLILRRSDGRELFNSRERARQLEYGKRFRVVGASHAEFRGRAVCFLDTDGGEHRFPLEQLADPVLIDEAAHPSPLLYRVLTAIEKNVTAVGGAGLGEAEAAMQTLLFDTFGYPPPQFQLLTHPGGDELPDYAACRRMGLLSEALFHELARLVCNGSPSEKLQTCGEWVRRFRRQGAVRGYRRFEPERMRESNRKLLGALPPEEFVRRAAPFALKMIARDPRFPALAKAKQSETAVLSEAAGWRF